MTNTKEQFTAVERAFMAGAIEGFALAFEQLVEDLKEVEKEQPSLKPLCEKLTDNMEAKQEEGKAWRKLLAARVMKHGPLKKD